MEARKRAVTSKYLQYITDPRYRRMYRDRIYLNVNQDVPKSDRRFMDARAMKNNVDESKDITMDPLISSSLMTRLPKWGMCRKDIIREESMQPVIGQDDV